MEAGHSGPALVLRSRNFSVAGHFGLMPFRSLAVVVGRIHNIKFKKNRKKLMDFILNAFINDSSKLLFKLLVFFI